jgi:hypothetical protein
MVKGLTRPVLRASYDRFLAPSRPAIVNQPGCGDQHRRGNAKRPVEQAAADPRPHVALDSIDQFRGHGWRVDCGRGEEFIQAPLRASLRLAGRACFQVSEKIVAPALRQLAIQIRIDQRAEAGTHGRLRLLWGRARGRWQCPPRQFRPTGFDFGELATHRLASAGERDFDRARVQTQHGGDFRLRQLLEGTQVQHRSLSWRQGFK